jgi:hypothetical protein
VQCDEAGGNLTVTLSSGARPVVLRILSKEPAGVTRDGIPVPKLATATQFDGAVTGWRADSQAGLVFIKFQHAGGVARIDF